MYRKKHILLAIAACLLVLTGATCRVAEAKKKGKVIRLEAIKVEGRIQKPEAFYILQRSNLNFEALELKQSFVPKIIESINDKPF